MAETKIPTLALRPVGEIPILGFGTWQLRGQEAYDSVLHALRVGYRHIDTATGYANEREVGRALRDSGVAREEVFITTKLPPERAGRERETIEDSLADLGIDAVDLWLIHWPPNGEAGVDTWRELLALREEGMARAVGVSNYSEAQLDELVAGSGEAPAVNQIRWSPEIYDARRARHGAELGIVLEGYSPFRASTLDEPVFREIASAHGVSPTQVILRWHVEHDVVVIPKSSTPERIEANFDIFGFQLTPEEVARMDGLSGAR